MQWGTDNEEFARADYELLTGVAVEQVGFAMPDHTDAYGCSPDGLVGDDGIVEIKCPAPETLIRYHAHGVLPDQYRPQVQGQLFRTGREWCDLFVWHPDLKPFHIRVEPDLKYQEKIAQCLLQLLQEIKQIEERVLCLN